MASVAGRRGEANHSRRKEMAETGLGSGPINRIPKGWEI
jgi:hypothetical protein